jgi:hypothetical protein
LPPFFRVFERVELDKDEDVVRVVDDAEDALDLGLLARPGLVLVEHGPSRVVVACLNPSDDECGRGNSFRWERAIVRLLLAA